MPFRRRYVKKRGAKRKMARRRYTRRNFISKDPFHRSYMAKLKYSDRVLISPGSGTPGVFVLSVNNLYDPQTSTGGHQPRGFDQLMAIYKRYTVVGAKVVLTALQSTSEAAQPELVGIYFSNSSSALPFSDYTESPSTKYKLLEPVLDHHVKVTHKVSVKKFFKSSSILSDDNLAGDVGSGPNKVLYAHCFSAPLNSALAAQLYAHIYIEFTAVFTDPNLLPES